MDGPVNPDFEDTIRASFARQHAMTLIRAQLAEVKPGAVEIRLPVWRGVGQQHGYVHGGVVGMIADSAGGYAAMTVAPADTSVLTVEYKLNLTAPAAGETIVARGTVLRAGRTLCTTRVDVFAVKESIETLCAAMQQTIMIMRGKDEAQR